MAGYAADSYARLRGVGAACLTYGVGTFGVLNALAGSYVEELPVVLIIGSPKFSQRQVERHEGVLFHHSTGTMQADVESVKNVVVAREVVRLARTGAGADRPRARGRPGLAPAGLHRGLPKRLDRDLPAALASARTGRSAALEARARSAIRRRKFSRSPKVNIVI